MLPRLLIFLLFLPASAFGYDRSGAFDVHVKIVGSCKVKQPFRNLRVRASELGAMHPRRLMDRLDDEGKAVLAGRERFKSYRLEVIGWASKRTLVGREISARSTEKTFVFPVDCKKTLLPFMAAEKNVGSPYVGKAQQKINKIKTFPEK